MQDFAGQRFGARQCTGLAPVVENQRVEVTVAGVKDVGDADVVLGAKAVDGGKGLAQFATRDHTILHNIIWAEPAYGRKRAFAPLPNAAAFGVIFGHADFLRARRGDNLFQLGELAFDLHGLRLRVRR